MLLQPGGKISRATEIEQCVGKRFQLLQWQGLDAGGGGIAQGPAATAKQSEGDCSSLGGAAASFSTSLTLLSAFFDQLLAEAGVAQVIGGEIDQGHDFLAGETGKPLPKNRENRVEQIGSWPEDLIGGPWNVGLGPHRQRQQVDQRIKPRLLAEILQAEPVHAGQKGLQLERQFGRPQPEPPVGHHDDDGQSTP